MSHGGRSPRRAGDRVEREIVERHKDLGIHAERYPLSGASKFRDSGHDIDVYAFGHDQAPLVAEVKARKEGKGFAQLEKWLSDYDILFLRRHHADPMVVLPWRVWQRLLTGKEPGNGHPSAEISRPPQPDEGARSEA